MNFNFKNIYLLLCLITFNLNVIAQNRSIDSLNIALNNAKHDSVRLRLYLTLSAECDIKDNLKYANPALDLANKLIVQTKDPLLKKKYLNQKLAAYNFISVYYERTERSGSKDQLNILEKIQETCKEANDTLGITNSIISFANYYYRDGNIIKQLEVLQNGLALWKKANYKIGMAKFIGEIGLLYANQGDTANAIDYLEKGIEIEKEIGDKNRISSNYYITGLLYSTLKYYTKAIYYYLEAVNRYTNSGELVKLPEIYLSLGETYQAKHDFKLAIEKYTIGFKLADQLKDNRVKFLISLALGSVDRETGDHKKAIARHQKDHELSTKMKGNYFAVWLASNALAKDHFAAKEYKKARSYSENALQIIKNKGTAIDNLNAEKIAYQIDSASNNYKDAHLHFTEYIRLRDQLNGEEVKKTATREKFQYELENQKQQAKAEQERKDQLNEKENQNKNNIIIAISFGLLLVLALAILIYRGSKQKQKINKELLYKNELIEKQKRLVDDKQKEILDSIKYASRIQKALLPSEKYIEKNIKRD